MYDSDEEGYDFDAATADQAMREDILMYFDRTGHLVRLESEGLRFKQHLLIGTDGRKDTDLPSFTSTVNLDLSLIAEISGQLSLVILEEPSRAHRLFKDVVHCSLVTLCCLPVVRTDQVQVVLRVRSLPAEGALTTEGTPLPDPTSRRLLLLQGVAASVTTPTKYTRSAVFRCPSRGCPGATGLRVWGPTTSRRRCRFCGGVSEEMTRGRDVGEQMLAVLVRPSALRAPGATTGQATVSHPIVVRFTDDLVGVDVLELGSRYDVVILTAGQPGAVAEAWGVRPWQDSALRRVALGLRSDPLPESIQSIWLQSSAESDSPWAFAVSLAAQLGGGLYPAHTFLHLKLGILLSLASQGLDHPPVALLAVGADPAGAALLSCCARLATRALNVLTTADFGKLSPAGTATRGAATKTHASAGAWLSGGPLVLARGGVCLLGCWDKWNRSSAALSVTSALESGKVVLESRDLAGAQLPSAGPSVPLQCAVWTYWTPGSKTKMSEILTLRTLLNTLGAPLLADSINDIEAEDISIHLLLKATGAQNMQSLVLEKDMFEFLLLVNAQPVALTDEATRLIQEYFVASRRARPNCLPVTAVRTMACMAEALARLSLRMEATWADVVLVVWMYETALNVLFGPCLISPLPDCCSQPLNVEHFIEQMDCRLDCMKVWLESFTKSVLLSSLCF